MSEKPIKSRTINSALGCLIEHSSGEVLFNHPIRGLCCGIF